MKNSFTFCMDQQVMKQEARVLAKKKDCSPRKQTLEYLAQFARVYQADTVLPMEWGGYVIN